MKFVKISIVALSMGMFLASCGGNAETEAPKTDTVAVPVVTEPAAPAVVDTTAAPATTDTTMKTTTTTTTTEKK